MDFSFKVLTHKDSNLDWRYQKPKCYRYTMGQYFNTKSYLIKQAQI